MHVHYTLLRWEEALKKNAAAEHPFVTHHAHFDVPAIFKNGHDRDRAAIRGINMRDGFVGVVEDFARPHVDGF